MIDHRRLGRELELFESDPIVGAGLPFWLPAGAAARHAIEEYIREEERLAGYQHVYSPPLARRELFERSGHLAKFADDMFSAIADGESELMLRPSLCPHHGLIFASRGRSYRELPVRIAELGPMFRAERSGVLSGLSRVRHISLNDAHIFCRIDQVGAEVAEVLAMMRRAHAALGLQPHAFRLSRRGPDGHYLGEAAAWERAEALLRDALESADVPFEDAPGEAAFYGPKIDVQVLDSAGREQSLATVQVDFVQPERLDLAYVDADGAKVRPVMVHRSIVGSLERLLGHLIEVHNGAFPVWYAPVQVVVAPVSEGQDKAARQFERACLVAGLRAEVAAEGSLGLRVRSAAKRRVPYVAVIGEREAALGEVSLRLRDGADLAARSESDAIGLIAAVAQARSPGLVPR